MSFPICSTGMMVVILLSVKCLLSHRSCNSFVILSLSEHGILELVLKVKEGHVLKTDTPHLSWALGHQGMGYEVIRLFSKGCGERAQDE